MAYFHASNLGAFAPRADDHEGYIEYSPRRELAIRRAILDGREPPDWADTGRNREVAEATIAIGEWAGDLASALHVEAADGREVIEIWDAERVLVGECAADIAIEPRAEVTSSRCGPHGLSFCSCDGTERPQEES